MHKVSIHIDGGYFLKQLWYIRPDFDRTVENAIKGLNWTVSGHLKKLNQIHNQENERALLYRVFYYDAVPFSGRVHTPITNELIDYSTTPQALFRKELFAHLKKQRNFALRLGKVYRESKWTLKEVTSDKLRKEKVNFDLSKITDEDFSYGLRQKGVDMRLGVDIASVVLKKQANIIVLLTGDSDFVPASKLARREGAQIILDPMWRSVSNDLFEHIDGLHSGLGRGQRTKE